MVGTVISGFLLPLMGSLLDRWGSRAMMIFSSCMLGTALFFLSFLDYAALWISRLPGGLPLTAVYMILLIPGVFSIRFFGQGLLPITSNTMVGKWFDKKRGRAIALMGVINSLAFSVAPAAMAVLVGRFAWNGAWRILALIVGIGMSLVAWAFFRDTPESCGLEVDGMVHGSRKHTSPAGEEPDHMKVSEPKAAAETFMYGLTRNQAVRTRAFWAVVLVTSTYALVITGLTFHIQAIGIQTGLSVAKAVAIFIPVSFIAVPVSFGAAVLADRIRIIWLVYVMALNQLMAYVAIIFLSTSVGYGLTIVGLGIASGLMGPLQAAAIPKLFGRRHLGSINGLVISIMVIMSAIGPILLSAVNDITGSLRFGIVLMSIFPLVTTVVAFRMPEQFR
jgi:MFS family permease